MYVTLLAKIRAMWNLSGVITPLKQSIQKVIFTRSRLSYSIIITI